MADNEWEAVHLKLLTDISDTIKTKSLECGHFMEYMKIFVPIGVLASKPTLLKKLEAIAAKSNLGVGNYGHLKKIAEYSDNAEILDMVKIAEHKIEVLQGRPGKKAEHKIVALQGKSEEQKLNQDKKADDECVAIHLKLLNEMSDTLITGSEAYASFIEHMNKIVSNSLLAGKHALVYKLEAMMAKGSFGVGNYEHLKKIAEDSGNGEILDMIIKAEHKIEALQGGSEELKLNQIKETDDEYVDISLKLLNDMSDTLEVGSEEYDNFIEHLKNIVPKGVLASKPYMLLVLEAMTAKGRLGVNNYEHLKKIAEYSRNGEILGMIKEAEQYIESFQGRSVEQKLNQIKTDDACRCIHLKLMTDISDTVATGSPKYERFIEHMKIIVPKGVLASKPSMLNKLETMTDIGKLSVGNYEHLKKIAEDSENREILDMIKEAEHNIEALQGDSEEQKLNQIKTDDVCRYIHLKLMTDISYNVKAESPEYERFIEQMKIIAQPEVLTSKPSILTKLEAMVDKGKLGVGNYIHLKQVATDNGNGKILYMIKEAEHDIEALKRGSELKPTQDKECDEEYVVIHLKLLNDISDTFEAGSGEYESFIEQIERIVPKEVLASKQSLLKELEAMADKGRLGVGNYEHLKKITEDSVKAKILNMVKMAEQKIEALKGRLVQKMIQDNEDEKYNGKTINELCKVNGRSSKEVLFRCKDVSREIKVLSNEIQCVWPGYKPLEPEKIVFVVFTEPEVTIELPLRLQSLDVVFKDTKSSSSEDKSIMSSDQKKNKPLTEQELSRLNDVFESKTDELLDMHKRLTVVSACSVKSKQYDTPDAQIINKTCIVLYVRVKGIIPIEEEPFPEEINGILTDVREGTFEFYGKTAKEHHTTLKIGCQISGNVPKYGTVGPFVIDKHNNICSLTSAHVFLSESEYNNLIISGKKLYTTNEKIAHQPISTAMGSKFGHVSNAVFRNGGNGRAGVEVVLVEITDANKLPQSNMFPEFVAENMETTGFGKFQPTFAGKSCDELQYGAIMLKFGCESGITRGFLEFRASVQQDSVPYTRLRNQINICSCSSGPFSVQGDSGSLVVIAYNGSLSDLRAIGIVTGGVPNGYLTFVTPLKDILVELDCKLCDFQEGMDDSA